MLARAGGASRRAATIASTAARQVPRRQFPQTARQISFWPWRKKPDPTLPVYFPKPAPSRGRPWKRTRQAVFTLAVYYVLWQIYMSVVLDPLFDWADHEWDSLSEQEKKEIEQEEEGEEWEPLLFLPFPFTTKEVVQPPYKGSDPEWKNYVAVSKDAKMREEMKAKLAEELRRRASAHPIIVRHAGDKNLKISKMWLEFLYPPRPPPKHYVSGLIVDYDGIFWGDRSMDSLAAKQLDSIIYPKAVALAVWTFWNVLIKRTKDDISKALGFEGPNQPETTWHSVVLERAQGQGPGPLSPAAKPPNATVVTPPSSPSKDAAGGGLYPLPDFTNMFRKQAQGEASSSPSMHGALQAASLTLAKNWKPAEIIVTRGCIVVSGLIELHGKTSRMVFQTTGAWDPKLKKYTKVKITLRHVMPFRQQPLGGRG